MCWHFDDDIDDEEEEDEEKEKEEEDDITWLGIVWHLVGLWGSFCLRGTIITLTNHYHHHLTYSLSS